MNFLEQLASEWYSYQGYFVRTNIKFGKRSNGGWKGEIDVAAYLVSTGNLIHIETSTDAHTWLKRASRLNKKFSDAAEHFHEIFDFTPVSFQRIAIVGFTYSSQPHIFAPPIEHISIPSFMQKISNKMLTLDPLKAAIPESYSLLRTIQFTTHYGISKKKG